MDAGAAPESPAHVSRRFAGWLALLMPLALLVSNAIVGAVQSDLPLPTTLLNNLLAIAWQFPWLVLTAVIGFFGTWALLQIGRQRFDKITRLRGGLLALAAAVVAAAAMTAFDQLVYQAASVSWTGDGASQQELMTATRNAIFVALSAVAGVVVAGLRRTEAMSRADVPSRAR
ncbi:hypothetical protein J2X03_003642 [Microbacterium trichothecenolyticum]|uniref:hypothetical protein n=1 Tax=Microbacterium trichothecenolyticum TaxID=69370 RepID=UPI002859AD75|nr:hypothetical protein [Microbacterium trichothecenolyticum]MDR7113742.1 hypothetical protein [Microbacterium trichothecenolyticum]